MQKKWIEYPALLKDIEIFTIWNVFDDSEYILFWPVDEIPKYWILGTK